MIKKNIIKLVNFCFKELFFSKPKSKRTIIKNGIKYKKTFLVKINKLKNIEKKLEMSLLFWVFIKHAK